MFTTGIFIALSVLTFGSMIITGLVPDLKYMQLSNAQVTVNDNNWISDVSMGFIDRKNKNTLVTFNFTAKNDWPDHLKVGLSAKYEKDVTFEHIVSVCDGLVDEDFGHTVPEAGLPSNDFPKECPFKKGEYSVFKYNAPTERRALPRGKFDGLITISDGDDVILLEIKLDGHVQNVPKKI